MTCDLCFTTNGMSRCPDTHPSPRISGVTPNHLFCKLRNQQRAPTGDVSSRAEAIDQSALSSPQSRRVPPPSLSASLFSPRPLNQHETLEQRAVSFIGGGRRGVTFPKCARSSLNTFVVKIPEHSMAVLRISFASVVVRSFLR